MTYPSVLFVDHTGTLGGAELYLLDLVHHYPGRSHVVLFEDGPLVHRLVEAGSTVEVIGGGGSMLGVKREDGWGRSLQAIPALMSLAARLTKRMRGYEVVFANSQKALVVSALSSWVAQRPLIWNLHDILTADHFSALNRKVAVALANRFARRVIVNSEATLRAFHEAGGAVEKGTVVYNGIDIAPFDSVRAEEVKALRRELGVGEVPVVGVFSRLAPWKGQHVLIEALPQLPGVHALFVGSALFGEDAYEDELHRLVEGMGVSDRAHFLGFRREVPLLMACCDVVAHTSIAPEPFGRVIIEAMAAGRPVVATQAGGALEIITDRETGRLVAPGDPTALATAVQAVLCEPEKGKLVRAANDHVRETFSVAVMVETATQVIASVG